MLAAIVIVALVVVIVMMTNKQPPERKQKGEPDTRPKEVAKAESVIAEKNEEFIKAQDAQIEAEKNAKELADAKAEAEQRIAEEQAKAKQLEEQQKALEQRVAALEAQFQAAEAEKAKAEAERIAKEKAEAEAAKAEAERVAKEKAEAEAKAKAEAEAKAAEAKRLEEEKRKAEEAARIAAEQALRDSQHKQQVIVYQDVNKGGGNSGWLKVGDYANDFFGTTYGSGKAKDNDISTVGIGPGTDVYLYDLVTYGGKMIHIHNGSEYDIFINLATNGASSLNGFTTNMSYSVLNSYNDIISAMRVREGNMDNKKLIDTDDPFFVDTATHDASVKLFQDVRKGGGSTDWLPAGEGKAKEYASGFFILNGTYSGSKSAKDNDISCIGIGPGTDIWIYDDQRMYDATIHFHNGTGEDVYIDLAENPNGSDWLKKDGWSGDFIDNAFYSSSAGSRLNQMNDKVSGIRVIKSARDNKKTIDATAYKDPPVEQAAVKTAPPPEVVSKPETVSDFQYRVRINQLGWQPWVTSGTTTGCPNQHITAIQFKYTGPGTFQCEGHCQDDGWKGYKGVNTTIGTETTKRLEAVRFKFSDSTVKFACYCFLKDYEWRSYRKNEEVCGTTGESRPMYFIRVDCSTNGTNDIGAFTPLTGLPVKIYPKGNTSKLIDTRERHNKDGSEFGIWTDQHDMLHANKVWIIDKEGHISPYANQNMFVYPKTIKDEERPVMYDKNKHPNEYNSTQGKWRLENDGSIVNIANPKYELNVNKAVYNDGQEIIMYHIEGNPNSAWFIRPCMGFFAYYIGRPFKLLNVGNDGYVMDSRGRQFGGGDFGIWSTKNHAAPNNIQWWVDSDGHITSWENKNSIIYLANVNNGTKPVIIGKAAEPNKVAAINSKWYLDATGHIGSFLECCSKKVMGVTSRNYADGTSIVIWDNDNDNNQRWYIVPVEFEGFIYKRYKESFRCTNRYVVRPRTNHAHFGYVKKPVFDMSTIPRYNTSNDKETKKEQFRAILGLRK